MKVLARYLPEATEENPPNTSKVLYLYMNLLAATSL
jgi:hypothetical protein